MNRRHTKKNIPIELLRALVTVVETRSFTKAAAALDLTQPAISTQIKRLGELLGGDIFANQRGDMTLTQRGRMVLQYARRMLAINDELLTFAPPVSAPRQLVVGLPGWLGYDQLIPIFERCSKPSSGESIQFRCDRSERLVADLNSGAIDVAYICNVSEPPRVAIAQWSERILWAKSPNLTLTPGDPIPLVSWPGTNTDRMAVELLQKNGTRFCVSFSAPDFAARLAAVVAGLGVLAVPSRLMFDRLEIVQDGLPALPDNKTGIFARDGLDVRRYAEFLKSLSDVVAPLPQHLCEAETVSEKPVAPKRGKETVSRRAAARVLIDQF